MNKKEIYNYCESISKKENIEFIYVNSYTEKAKGEGFDLKNIENLQNQALKIRVIENWITGSTTIRNITKSEIKKAISKAKKIARLKSDTVKIKDFGSDKAKANIKQDKSLNKINSTDYLKEIEKNLTKDKYITSYNFEFEKSTKNSFYINPYTKKDNPEKSSLYLGIEVFTKYKKPNNAVNEEIFTKKQDININQAFNQAKTNAYNTLNPIQGKKGEFDIILIPEVFEGFFENLVLKATLGENIQNSDSFLTNLKGKQIFSKKLNVTEEPRLDYFLGSSSLDFEGFKTTKKQIFNQGIFKKDIYNQYNATKYNKKPTGNGFLPSIYSDAIEGHTNIIIENGNKKIEDIIKNTKKGILVYSLMGHHTNKITTGDFSLTITSAKLIENGEMTKTIKNINFSGNIKDILKDIELSKEIKFSGDSVYPFIKIKNAKVI